MKCHSCNHENNDAARFCASCGHSLAQNQACEHCGASLPVGARFCGECGKSSAAPEVSPGPGSFVNGFWDKGEDELVRLVSEADMVGRFFDTGGAPNERGFWAMLKSLGRGAIDALQGRTVQIPSGCIGALVYNGGVVEILPPGRQTTVKGLWDSLVRGNGGSPNLDSAAVTNSLLDSLATNLDGNKPALYLIDRRPVPFHIQVEVPGSQAGQAITLGVSVTAHAITGTSDAAKDSLTRFIQNIVRERDVLTARNVREMVRPHIERTARDVARTFRPGSTDYDAITQGITSDLANAIGANGGLSFEVRVTPRAAIVSLNLHLGLAQLPELAPCVHAACDGQVRFGAMYCPECGNRQPIQQNNQRICKAIGTDGTPCGAFVPLNGRFCKECGNPFSGDAPEEARLITRDGELVELDLVLRAQGNRELEDPTPIHQAITNAVSRLVRQMDHAQIASPEGLQNIGEGLKTIAEQTLRALQLTLLDITVLDCKSKNGEWLMGARAELKRARLEQDLANEWLAVDAAQITLDGQRIELDLQKLDVEQMRLDVELRQLRMQRDLAFEVRAIERENELRTIEAETSHLRAIDETRLVDREARQDQSNRAATLDVQDAQRTANTEVATDEAYRNRNRTLRDRDQEDILEESAQAHARALQEAEQVLAVEEQEGVRQTAEDLRRRKRESDEMGHQMDLEDRSAEHDDKQARRAMTLDSDRQRLSADDTDYSDRKARDRDLHYQKEQVNLDLDVQARSQDIELHGQRSRMEIDQDSRDRDHGRQKDMLQMEQDAEAKERDWQLQVLRQKAEAEQARLRAEAESKSMVNQSLAGWSAEQIAAAAMQGRTLSDAEANVLAEGLSGKGRTEMMERMLADREAAMNQRMADKDSNQAQMMAMFQQMAQEKNADSNRMAATFQQMMETMAANTAALAGAQQMRDQRAHQEVVAAQREAQQQARSMAERSMDSMAQVASSRAAPAPAYAPQAAPQPTVAPVAATPKSAATTCRNPSCGQPLEPSAKFCTSCGKRPEE